MILNESPNRDPLIMILNESRNRDPLMILNESPNQNPCTRVIFNESFIIFVFFSDPLLMEAP